MNKWILKSNKWYDNVREPYRFSLLLVVMAIVLIIPSFYNDSHLTFAFTALILTTWRMWGKWLITVKKTV